MGTFIGGLKPEIADDIRMFKLKTPKYEISLARMCEELLGRQDRLI